MTSINARLAGMRGIIYTLRERVHVIGWECFQKLPFLSMITLKSRNDILSLITGCHGFAAICFKNMFVDN